MIPIPTNEAARLAAMAEVDVAACDAEGLDALASLARAVFDVPVAAVTLIGSETAHVMAPAAYVGHASPRQDVPCAHTIAGSDVLTVPDLAADHRFRDLPTVVGEPHFRFYAGVPLSRGDGLNLGTFCLFDFAPRGLTSEQVSQLRDFGRTATSLIRLREANRLLVASGADLRHAATTDPLTACFNRIGLRERVGDLFDRQSRSALIYVDIDRFKETNDRFGHPAGDVVLCETARRLRAACRPSDMVARIGGDEFCVVLSDMADDAALERVAGRIVEACHEPVVHDGVAIECSVSVGAALSPLHAAGREGMARLADAALYRAKAEGRDRYALAA